MRKQEEDEVAIESSCAGLLLFGNGTCPGVGLLHPRRPRSPFAAGLVDPVADTNLAVVLGLRVHGFTPLCRDPDYLDLGGSCLYHRSLREFTELQSRCLGKTRFRAARRV